MQIDVISMRKRNHTRTHTHAAVEDQSSSLHCARCWLVLVHSTTYEVYVPQYAVFIASTSYCVLVYSLVPRTRYVVAVHTVQSTACLCAHTYEYGCTVYMIVRTCTCTYCSTQVRDSTVYMHYSYVCTCTSWSFYRLPHLRASLSLS